MSKKSLYIIIAVLVVILAAGLIMIFVLPNPLDVPERPQQDAAQTEQTGTTGENAEVPSGTDATADSETSAAAEETQATEESGTETVVVTVPATETTEQEGPLIPTSTPEASLPKDDGAVTYLDYISMTGEQQAAFINTFASYDAFFAWFNAAKQEYEDSLIEIDGSTPVDMGGVVGGNG